MLLQRQQWQLYYQSQGWAWVVLVLAETEYTFLGTLMLQLSYVLVC